MWEMSARHTYLVDCLSYRETCIEHKREREQFHARQLSSIGKVFEVLS